MSGRKSPTRNSSRGHRRLEFESLEHRIVLSGSDVLDASAPQPLIVQLDAEEIPLAAVIDALVTTLPYYQFNELTPAQVPLLTLAQVASIPNLTWFAAMSDAARAALTMPQVRALQVDAVRITLLTPLQISWLTTAQVQSLSFHDFHLLSAAQTPLLTPAQIASIPDTGAFITWSEAARAALTAPQVRALNTATIRLDLLTAAQVQVLTTAQIQAIDFYQFKYLSASQTPLLTGPQIASIPDSGTFVQWSAAARAALGAGHIQMLRVSTIGIDLLTPLQVTWLTTGQIQSLDYFNFELLAPFQVVSLTPAQIATIPNTGSFIRWSNAARAALTPLQVQALDTGTIRLDLLTATQVSWLNVSQIQALDFYQFPLLSAFQTPFLTAAQVATIPDVGTFGQWSSAARQALTPTQVRALRVATVRLFLLTSQQRDWLTPTQVQSLKYWDFHYLSAAQTPNLTPTQLATIPSVGWFGAWSTAARAALSAPQVQALNAVALRLEFLTPSQIGSLTAAQIRGLQYSQFKYLNALQTPVLTVAQIASIPDIGNFSEWSDSARAALTATHIQALRPSVLRLSLLTPAQVAALTVLQIRSLNFYEFPALLPSQVPFLTTGQVATIPDPGTFSQWTVLSRAALTGVQIQALRVATVRLGLLTPAQIGALTTAQIRSLDFYEFSYLHPWQVAALTTAQIASIPDPGAFGKWSAAARSSLTGPQLHALRVADIRLYLLTTDQIRSLTAAQVQSLDSFEFERLLPEQIPLLTTTQIASMPANYNVRAWSDQHLIQLSRDQILAMPIPVYGAYISLQAALRPPSNYDPVDPAHAGHGGHDLDAPSAEADQVFNLVPMAAATHVTIRSGNWMDPTIWRNGVVPGAGAKVVIATGTSVNFNAYMETAIFTLRIDGTMKFAPNVNTQLKVDTIVVTTHGVLHIGAPGAPIADNVTATVLIADNGPINTTWDPFLWSRGLVSRGEVRMQGRVVSPYLNLAVDPRAGDSALLFTQPPVGWKVGDEIVVGGVNQYSEDFGTERVRIRSINGTWVTIDPLRYNHDAPDGHGLSIQVANLNRNVQFVAESNSVHLERPHIAFIHNPNVVVENIGVYGFGRTDKNLPINSSIVVGGVKQPGTGTNPRARYVIHFHHAGVDPSVAPAVIRGSVASGSPGWGFVNHSSNVVMENNVAFNMIGAGFVSEDGNEIGVMRGNLAINMYGSDDGILSRQDDHDFGHGGHGFWFQGPGIEVVNNISVGSRDAAFAYITQSSKNQFDAVNLDPTFAGGRLAVPVGTVPLNRFDGNIAAVSKTGLEIWHHMTLMTDGETIINNFTSWNSKYAGVDLLYSGHVTISNSKLLGDLNLYMGVGIATNRLTHDVTMVNNHVEGFEVGVDMPVRRSSLLYGGKIIAVQAVMIEKGYDTTRVATVDRTVTIATPSAAQLRGRPSYAIYAFGDYDFEYPNFLDRRVDSLLSQDVIRVAYNGSATAQLYFYQQTASYVPFTASKASEYVDASLLNKTNSQLRTQFGYNYGGDLLPASVVSVPGVYGFLRF